MFILYFYLTKYVHVYKYKYIILYYDISVVGIPVIPTLMYIYMYNYFYIHTYF